MRQSVRYLGWTFAWLIAAGAGEGAMAAATTNKTYPAGKPPFYRGDAPAGGRVAHLPVRVAPAPDGITETPELRRALERLAADLTEQLDSLLERPASGGVVLPGDGEPGVYLGCALDGTWECDAENRQMVLEVTGPSKRWREALAQGLAENEADFILIPTLTVSDHWLRQKNWKGAKEIPLGTGYSQAVPWLTSLDTPAQVVQLTAVLVDAEGRIVRSGAEGMLALRTAFSASVAGLQRIASPDEIEQLRADLRREDLSARPLVREAALDALVRQIVAPAGAPGIAP